MFDWFRHLFSINGGHAEREKLVTSAHDALRLAAEKHIEADREAECVLRGTVNHTNGLIKTAQNALAAVKHGSDD